jgi:hypothetical protein
MSSDSRLTRNASIKTPEQYWLQLNPEVRASFSSVQQNAVMDVLEQAIAKPAPKLVDLRFGIDLVLTRFYVVLLVGRDRRHQSRSHVPSSKAAKVGNLVAAIVLLLGLNLTLSGLILLVLYLLKSALGFDFLPGHISQTLSNFVSPE